MARRISAIIYECDPTVNDETFCVHLSNGWEYFFKSRESAESYLRDQRIPIHRDTRLDDIRSTEPVVVIPGKDELGYKIPQPTGWEPKYYGG